MWCNRVALEVWNENNKGFKSYYWEGNIFDQPFWLAVLLSDIGKIKAEHNGN